MTDRESTTCAVTGGSPETAGAEAVGSHSGRRSTRENVWTARMARLLLRHRSVLYPLLCCAAVLICTALAHPFANSAFNDDWAYSHVALKLAETGRLHYSGWGSPMILVQSVWGAAWIRFFGFSFNVLRIASIPFSLGFVLLVYGLGRRVGLTRDFALFGALTVGTSPLFVPLAASFMTEAYSCCFIMACLYAAVASAESATEVSGRRWLWLLAILGVIGGSNRQVVWAAPVALIPYLFWTKRSDRRFARHALVAYVVCIGCIALLMAKLSQPYAPLELPKQQILEVVLQRSWTLPLFLLIFALSNALICCPALFCLAPLWKKLRVLQLIKFGLLCAAGAGSLLVVFGVRIGIAPFLGNILSPFGILHAGEDALGFRPPVLLLPARLGLTWLVLFSVVACGYLWRTRFVRLKHIPIAVFVLFSATYILLLLPGALVGVLYDRYALPIFPVLVIVILLAFQFQVHRVPPAAWVCLVLFASYAVVTTHDYSSALRARVLAAQKLEERSIPRKLISAGIEYDAWTQLQVAGTMRPALYGDRTELTVWNRFWFWDKATALNPEYVACYWSSERVPPRSLVTVPFRTWVAPFRRNVVVLRRSELPGEPQLSKPR